MTLQLRNWKFPSGPDDTETSTFQIPAGETSINVPAILLQRYRNLSLEFVFSGITAADENLTVNFQRANSSQAYDAANIENVGEAITLTSAVISNPNLVFIRDFKNIDNLLFRFVIDAPVGVTASLLVNVSAGEGVV